MKQFGPLTLFVLAAGACSDGATGPNPPARADAPHYQAGAPAAGQVKDRYIVVLRNAPGIDAGRDAGDAIRVHGAKVHQIYQHALRGYAAELTPGAVVRLRAHPDVQAIYPDGYVSAVATQTPVPAWGLDRVDQRPRTLDNNYTYNATGAGVNVYILDTGIRTTHAEFGGRAFGAFTAILDGNGTNDCDGHGTHVAGTVGGSNYGIAKGVRLYAVRVLDCTGNGTYSQVIAGVDWVTANHVSPSVVNMSLGGPAYAPLDQAIQNSIASGVTYAIAAGNSGANACNESPGRVPAAITVGATTSSDSRPGFSNYGSCVDLFAPGMNVLSAWSTGDAATNTISGTSMATPHVAGAAALYLELNPAATPAQVASALTTNATQNLITGVGTGSPNRLLYTGFIGSGSPPPPPPPPPGDQPPVAAIASTCNDATLTCGFNASGSTDDHQIASGLWEFGDGTTATPKIVNHTFPVAGTYTVKLTVVDNIGQSNTATKVITIGDLPPVASFSASCTNLVCSFDGTGSTDDHGVTGYAWAFGDGATAGGATASHSYAAGGTFAVTLTVTDAVGHSNSATQSVTVVPDFPPTAAFTAACTNLSCSFDGGGSADDHGIVSYAWDFGDGASGSGSSPAHAYAIGGTFTVTLTVTDPSNQIGTASQTVTVTPPDLPPNAAFGSSCTNLSCTFDGTASTDDNAIVSYAWDFGDGSTGAGATASHVYAAAGTYTVSLTVTDAASQSSTATSTVTVTAPTPVDLPPVASYTVTCDATRYCTFDSRASTDDHGIVSRLWTMGDGRVYTGNVAVGHHRYASRGTYTTTLQVTDTAGQTHTVSRVVTLP